MERLRDEIIEKTGIDIERDENVFKLYKIDSLPMSREEIEGKIRETRNRWNASVNGTNERFASRDKKRLDKADAYEKILLDESLSGKLFSYYQNPDADSGTSKSSGQAATPGMGFVRDFFRVIRNSRKIRDDDVEFFLDYYSMRKQKKAVLQILESEYGYKESRKKKAEGNLTKEEGGGAKEKQDEQKAEELDGLDLDVRGKHKSNPDWMVQNLILQKTLYMIRKCENLLEESCKNPKVLERYPELNQGLFVFLKLTQMKSLADYEIRVDELGKTVYSYRQEYGEEFIPLVDLCNRLKALAKQRDVIDNYPVFKLLIKYSALSPYMYLLDVVKQETLKELSKIAAKEYRFRNINEFIVNYFMQVYENFAIDADPVRKQINDAKRTEGATKVINGIEEKLGIVRKDGKHILADIAYYVAYLPIQLLYLLIDVICKGRKIIPYVVPALAGFVVFMLTNGFWGNLSTAHNLFDLRYFNDQEKWLPWALELWRTEQFMDVDDAIWSSASTAVWYIVRYLFPALGTGILLLKALKGFYRDVDWIGIHRTIAQPVSHIREVCEKLFEKDEKQYYKRILPRIIVNILIIIACFGIIFILKNAPKPSGSAGPSQDVYEDFIQQ